MSVVTLTENAASRIKKMIDNSEKPVIGLRLSVSKKGCSGNSYKMDYVEQAVPGDDLVEQHGVKLFVDPLAFMYIFGTTMDWKEGVFESGFTFTNPNEKGRCGCGESFHI